MPLLEVAMVQVREVIRRWQAGENKTAIGRASGISRRTVGRYIAVAETLGVAQDGEPPGEGALAQPLQRNHAGPLPQGVGPVAQVLAGQDARIANWLMDDLQLSRIHELLAGEGVAVSYTTLRRYVRQAGLWKRTKTTVRMADWPPGEVAEMDFGKLGMLVDATTAKKHVVWALIVVLPASRHSFVWPLLRRVGILWRRASRGWRRPGASSVAYPGASSSTTSVRPSPAQTPSTHDRLAASLSTARRAASSATRPGCGGRRIRTTHQTAPRSLHAPRVRWRGSFHLPFTGWSPTGGSKRHSPLLL